MNKDYISNCKNKIYVFSKLYNEINITGRCFYLFLRNINTLIANLLYGLFVLVAIK